MTAPTTLVVGAVTAHIQELIEGRPNTPPHRVAGREEDTPDELD